MQEEYLHYIWKFQLMNLNLFTLEDEEIFIKQAGYHNKDSGPDFSEAMVRIGDKLWAGNIEIHVKSSDWFKHGHHKDDAYKSVILHVVYENDLCSKKLNQIKTPLVEIKHHIDYNNYHKYLSFLSNMSWIPCENQIKQVDHFKLYFFFSRLAIERLESKSNYILKFLTELNNNLEECLYILIARNFGFKTNAAAFELLAKNLPLKTLIKHKDNLFQIEALLFGQSGLLETRFGEGYPKSLRKEYSFLRKKYGLKPNNTFAWKFLRLRPLNFPTLRIAQFAVFIYKSSLLLSTILNCESIEQMKKLFNISPSEYWLTHYRFGGKTKSKPKLLGSKSQDLIIINTIIPFLYVYGKYKNDDTYCKRAVSFLELIKPENNNIIRKWKSIGIQSTSAYFSQALIHLKNEYCDKKKCLDCQIGIELLKR